MLDKASTIAYNTAKDIMRMREVCCMLYKNWKKDIWSIPNLLSLFISAPLEDRIARVAKRQKVTPEEAKSLIQKTDKRRASYCEYYASKKWGAVDAYDFCLNSSALGLGGTVELIQAMVAHKEHPIPSPTEIDPTQTEA